MVAQQKCPGFKSTLGLGSLSVEFGRSPSVCMGSLQVLRVPPTVQTHAFSGVTLTGDSKLGHRYESEYEWLAVSMC